MNDSHKDLKPETVVLHGRRGGNKTAGAPVVRPEIRSTIFGHPPDHKSAEFQYTRNENPNRGELETVLAALEGGTECAAFASGMAAISAVFQALKPGDHVLIPRDIYHGTRRFIFEVMKGWGVDAEEVDMGNADGVEAAIRKNTVLLWVETPSNPMLHISDIAALAGLAKKAGVLLAVDNTWPSPLNQKPLELGADLVMHSSTKYLGGHSDILGGAVISRENSAFFERIRSIQMMAGAVPSPNDCWMLVRSIKTLAVRMRAHNENAMKIAQFLENHRSVKKVYYPGLASHPGHQTAGNQMKGFGGMLSFEIDGGPGEALKVVNSSRVITPATSLGGVESLWEHRLSVEGEGSQTPAGLIRFSVGIEHIDDLIDDLSRTLDRAG